MKPIKQLISFIFLTLFVATHLQAQETNKVPKNNFLANSPWPTYHGDNYRQSSTYIKGPTKGDKIELKILKKIKGGTSPWTYLSDKYPNGKRVLLQSNATHFYKIIDDNNGLRIIAKQKIDGDWLKSFGWNMLQTKGNVWYTYDPKYNPKRNQYTRLFKITDVNPKNPYSRIQVVDTFSFKNTKIGKVQHYGINYNGQIVFASDNDKGKTNCTVGIISPDFKLLKTLKLKSLPNEIFGHNAFPIDENNSFYIVTTKRLIRVDWKNNQLSIGFEAYYDFVADGPTGKFAEGSGTTPTLMGTQKGKDRLIVMADGHQKNNLVAFWREIPKDWKGIKGQDIRLAGKIQLPAAQKFSNLFQSIENSPTVFGYDVAIAQFNGFLGQRKKTYKGVQKIRWNTTLNKFEVSWVNKQINMNGVLTYSKGANLVYGSGKEGCSFYYYGLNWDTGAVEFKYKLGSNCRKMFNPFDDGGNNNIIDEQGNIYFSGGGSLLKLEKQ